MQVEKLSQQLQEVRDELEELAVAERVARRLTEQLHAELIACFVKGSRAATAGPDRCGSRGRPGASASTQLT
jgi:hypothetical protein